VEILHARNILDGFISCSFHGIAVTSHEHW
jgi:hypothetical protein